MITVSIALVICVTPTWAQVPSNEKEAHARWADCQSDANLNAAIKACTDLLAMNPIRSYSFWRQQAREKKLIPDSLGRAYSRRAALYERNGQLDLAIADYRSATNHLPGDTQAFMSLALALVQKHDADGAIEAFGKAIALDPKQTLAFVGRSVLFLAKGDLFRAQEDMNRAAALDPQTIERLENSAQTDEIRALAHSAREAGADVPRK